MGILDELKQLFAGVTPETEYRAISLGIGRAALDLALSYVSEREAFGAAVGALQPGRDLDRGRLARTVGAQHAGHLAPVTPDLTHQFARFISGDAAAHDQQNARSAHAPRLSHALLRAPVPPKCVPLSSQASRRACDRRAPVRPASRPVTAPMRKNP